MTSTPATGPWVGTSWKMNHTLATAREYATTLATAAAPGRWPGVQPFVIPPFTALHTVAGLLAGTPVLVGAQNAHWADAGAWTGEVSVPQVADAGARLAEIGHSERREHFGETDRTVNLKTRAAVRHGLTPLVCVGETAEVRDRGGQAAVDHVLTQVEVALVGVDQSAVVLAYEPVWAIGEGGRPATVADIAPVHQAVVERFGGLHRVLYGGSVNHDNARDLLSVPGVGGLFVGRAAWRAEGYLALLDLVSGG